MLTINVPSHKVLNRFDPRQAFGFCLDGGTPDEAALAAVDLPGALLNLDLVAGFLAQGGHAAYLLRRPARAALPGPPRSVGRPATALPDGTRLPTYWAARLLTEDW